MAVIFAAALVLPRSATSQHSEIIWEYVPKQKYHEAIVEIKAGPNGGSGVFVWRYKEKQIGYILSARHVFEPTHVRCTVKFQNGHVANGEVRSTDPASDTALVWIPEPPAGIPTIPLAKDMPVHGSTAEICGYGGQNQFRAFRTILMPPVQSHYGWSSRSCVISGDSGGAIIWKTKEGKPKVIGIVSGGPESSRVNLRDQHGQNWNVVYPASGGNCVQMRQKLFHLNASQVRPQQQISPRSGPAQYFANPGGAPQYNPNNVQPRVRPERPNYQPQYMQPQMMPFNFNGFNNFGQQYCPT